MRRSGLAVFALLALSAGRAGADEPSPSPYRFRPALDLPILGLGLATTAAVFVEPQAPACLPSCEPPPGMSPLDRRVLGNYSPAAHRAADLVIAGLIVVPPSVALVANGLGDGRAFFENLALSVETVVLTQGLTQLTKAAVDRYAPIVYDERVPLEERMSKDALGSFWSGHTATAFATATSFVVSYWIRHPRDPWRWVILATLESAALSVGLLKMRAGYHYPSDVAAGALVGTSLGVLVPTLHTRF
jgi:membrane-associated phospholipid phosphatase